MSQVSVDVLREFIADRLKGIWDTLREVRVSLKHLADLARLQDEINKAQSKRIDYIEEAFKETLIELAKENLEHRVMHNPDGAKSN